MRRALPALALLAAASAANAQDLLSGEYLPKDAAKGETAMRVAQDGAGWTAWFNGEAKRLDAVSGNQLGALFPGLDDTSHPQCGVSEKLLLCHVDRGTRFEDAGFTASTGYFALFIDGGAFELVRLPPADNAN
jgi:hypothetical protein